MKEKPVREFVLMAIVRLLFAPGLSFIAAAMWWEKKFPNKKRSHVNREPSIRDFLFMSIAFVLLLPLMIFLFCIGWWDSKVDYVDYGLLRDELGIWNQAVNARQIRDWDKAVKIYDRREGQKPQPRVWIYRLILSPGRLY
jgi:hypothetical protein